MKFELMILLRRIAAYLPFLAASAIFISLYSVTQSSERLPYVIGILGVIVLATSGALSFQALWRGSAIAPGAMPALLVGGATFAFLFIEEPLLRIVVALLTSLLFFVLVRHLAESTKLFSAQAELRALSEWSALIALVGLSAGLLASVTFLNWNIWLSALVFAAVAIYSSFTLSRLGRLTGLLVPSMVSLLIIEGFVVIGMLPISHWVGACVLGAVSYLLFSTLTSVPFGSFKRAVISAGVICGVLLVTARWR